MCDVGRPQDLLLCRGSWTVALLRNCLINQCVTEIDQYCIDYLQRSHPGNGGRHMTGRIHVGEAKLFKLNGHPAVAEIKQAHSNTQQHIHMITNRERSAHP